MNVNRKDTILVAVLVNVGLLAVLFVTSLSTEETSPPLVVEQDEQVIEQEYVRHEPIPIETPALSHVPVDEVDEVLQKFVSRQEPVIEETPLSKPQDNTIEITVKRGDALDKIARANRTSVQEIKKLNKLTSDRLKIGQVLKIPLPDAIATAEPAKPVQQDTKEVWYDVQSGDNPWKIAKKFHVSYSHLLEINRLDEAKARNLKPGDKIRIK